MRSPYAWIPDSWKFNALCNLEQTEDNKGSVALVA